MDFGLSEEQEILQETVAGWVENECPVTRVRELFDGDEGYPDALWSGLAELGIAGLLVPEAYGGAGLEMVDLALVAEVLGRGAVPGPFFGHSLACAALVAGGSDAQKERWLPKLASGEIVGGVALAEGEGGWLPDAWRAELRDGRIRGQKSWSPYASRADLLVVGATGGALVLVERGAEGVKTSPVDSLDRTRRLDDVVLESAPCEPLADARTAGRVRDAGLVLLAADAFGGATRLLDLSVAYAKDREQFGVTIAHFQSVKHRLAEMAVEIEPARGLYWWAAHAWDALPQQSERAAAVAKAHLTDRFLAVAREAVEIHGGIGFTWECDVQFWFKRAMFDRVVLGDPGLHRERAAQLAGW